MKTVMMTVKSSNIDSIGYDEKKFQLLVTFKNGKTFGYKYISSFEFEGLLWAESVGKRFNQFIKPNKVAFEILDAKEEYPNQCEWRSIDDSRLDYTDGNKVLGFGSGCIFEAECEDGFWCNVGGEDMTHWMPLPEPPK